MPRDLARALDKEAKKRSMTRSEFVRDSVRRQIAFTSLRELQQAATRHASKAGIQTLNDAVRAVRSLRRG